jgi:tetratricopeptide (TPR) repeat protein
VESVAWVAERKDVLSTLFWMLTMWCYVRYLERPGVSRYLLVVVFFVMGLMAKPMLVTLPFVLLLLDYWPLGRIQFRHLRDLIHQPKQRSLALRLVWEKIPLFIVVLVSSIVAYFAQETGGAIASYSLGVRIANALVSYTIYVAKTIWPYHLAIPYPHPGTIPFWKVAGAALLLTSVSVIVIRWGRKRPHLMVGWFWYLGTLVPVCGLVQLGSYAMADRFTYIPLTGLFILIAWGISDLTARWRYQRIVLAISTGTVLSALMFYSWQQVGFWQNSITLFKHTLDVTTNNWLAHNNIGNALAGQGKIDEAIAHYWESLKIHPGWAPVHNNLGNALAKRGKTDEAITHYMQALRIDPGFAEAHNNLGAALTTQGRFEEAVFHCSEALRIDPGRAETHCALGTALVGQGRLDEAIRHFSNALKIKPDFADAHNDLGLTLKRQGKVKEAMCYFSEAVKIKPDFAQGHLNLGMVLAEQGRLEEATHYFAEAVRIAPESADAHYNLALALAIQGKRKQAIRHFSEGVRIRPDFAEAHFNLGAMLASQARLDEAISHFKEALRIRPDFVEAKHYLEQALKESGKHE